jgi:hypothetical protein
MLSNLYEQDRVFENLKYCVGSLIKRQSVPSNDRR